MTDGIINNNNASHTLINNLALQQQANIKKLTEHQKTLKQLISAHNLRKILKKTHTQIRNLQFITYQQFIQQNELSIINEQYSDRYDYHDRYEIQLQRRIRQLKILLQMEQRLEHEKNNINSSSKKSSRANLLTPQQERIQSQFHNKSSIPKSSRKSTNLKRSSSKSHEDIHQIKSKRSNNQRCHYSKSSSLFSRQHSNIQLQTHRRLKEIQIFQTFTQGRPYIEQYFNHYHYRHTDFDKNEKNEHKKLKTIPIMAMSSRKKINSNEIGSIRKQNIVKKVFQDQYINSPHGFKIKKQRQKVQKQEGRQRNKTQTVEMNEMNDNEYEMIVPLRNQKIQDKLKKKYQKDNQKQTCRQLIKEVKKYEEFNQKCMKKLKSIDRNDVKSKQKVLVFSSREKIIKKNNIQKLKDRITSKQQQQNSSR